MELISSQWKTANKPWIESELKVLKISETAIKSDSFLKMVITPTTVVLPIQNDYLIANPPYT